MLINFMLIKKNMYKVAEMTNDKIISLLCLEPPYLLVVTDGTEFVNI